VKFGRWQVKSQKSKVGSFWEGGGCLVVGMLAPKRCKHGTAQGFWRLLADGVLPFAARPDHEVVGPPAGKGSRLASGR
jgi:hypothetical protein